MMRQKITTILGGVLVFACVANAGFAQTQATTTNGPQPSGDQSAAAMAQQASNPFASSWALQLQQNNNWTEMPRGDDHTRVQSSLTFQPLISLRLTEKQGLIVRPMVPIVNSVPYFDQSGQNERTAGFGDTVLAFALPRSLLGGRLMVGAGPTFIFPTASKDLLSQDAWQVGPDGGAVLLDKHFIAYGFVQQWFKVGGDGRDTNQMSGTFNFTYLFANGWTIGTQPQLSVDWKSPGGERGTLQSGTTGGQDVQVRRPADAAPAPGSVLPGSSRRRRSEMEYSAASDADDSGPHQEGALLTRGEAVMAASTSANELSVETRQAGAHTIVVVIGRVTVDSSPHLRSVLHDAIGAAPSTGVVIDFTGTSYLDTSAIATLLEAATLALHAAYALRVIGLRGDARFVAEATELDHIFLALGYEVQFT